MILSALSMVLQLELNPFIVKMRVLELKMTELQ